MDLRPLMTLSLFDAVDPREHARAEPMVSPYLLRPLRRLADLMPDLDRATLAAAVSREA